MATLFYILQFFFLAFVAVAFGYYSVSFLVSEDFFIAVVLLTGSLVATIEIIKKIKEIKAWIKSK